jgi:alkylation response protein AidB-like acyl-CoA dehydrogenase
VKSEDRFASWNTFSPQFSRELGKQGWIGITWPKQYGGSEKSFLERYVVTEELLGNSAPAGAHWVADRQSGPLLLRFGSEEQRQAILPRITAGECFFSIGMSEPDFRVGPRLGAYACRAGAGRLPRQRHQGLDLGRASQPLLHRAGAHLRSSTATGTRG